MAPWYEIKTRRAMGFNNQIDRMVIEDRKLEPGDEIILRQNDIETMAVRIDSDDEATVVAESVHSREPNITQKGNTVEVGSIPIESNKEYTVSGEPGTRIITIPEEDNRIEWKEEV